MELPQNKFTDMMREYIDGCETFLNSLATKYDVDPSVIGTINFISIIDEDKYDEVSDLVEAGVEQEVPEYKMCNYYSANKEDFEQMVEDIMDSYQTDTIEFWENFGLN